MFAREAPQNRFAGRNLNKVKDRQREQNQDHVREPRIERFKMKALRHMVSMNKLEDIEVEKIEAIAALTDEKKRPPGEEGRNRMRSAESENQRGEDRSHQATMHQQIGGAKHQGVEENSDCNEAYS